MEDVYQNFAKSLKALRRRKRKSQRVIGECVGVCHQTVSQWEDGKRKPSLENAQRVAEFFQVSLDDMIGNKYIKQTDESK